MPRGGSKPGEHRGGRKPGKPNKAVVAQAELRTERAKAEGKMPPHEALLLVQEICRSRMARYQPGTEEKPNDEYDPELFAFWLQQTMRAASLAAPYFAPRLSAVALAASLTDQSVRDDPRESLLRMILQMRERGRTLKLKDVTPSKNGKLIEAKVEQTEEDDTDYDGELS